jgi:hypothetical protein
MSEVQNMNVALETVRDILADGGENFHPASADVEVIRALHQEHPDPLVRVLASHIISLRHAIAIEQENCLR